MNSKRKLPTWSEAIEIVERSTQEVSSPELVENPVVSVCLYAFNQQKFIRESIESVLDQNVDFPFEIVVGDDHSSDGTTEILKEYQKLHPDKIRLFLAHENLGQHTRNGRLNFIRELINARGRYLIILEGDDYWTDSDKLAKQVSSLEARPDSMGCFQDTLVVQNDGKRESIPWPFEYQDRVEFGIDDTISYVPICHTSSFMFRREILNFPMPDWFVEVPSPDMVLFSLAASRGPLLRIPNVGSHYRVNDHGVTSTTGLHRGVGLPINRYYTFGLLDSYLSLESSASIKKIKSHSLRQIALATFRKPMASLAILKQRRNWLGASGILGTIWAMFVSSPALISMVFTKPFRSRRDHVLPEVAGQDPKP